MYHTVCGSGANGKMGWGRESNVFGLDERCMWRGNHEAKQQYNNNLDPSKKSRNERFIRKPVRGAYYGMLTRKMSSKSN